MSPIALGLDFILIGLLVAALVFGMRLNRRLKALRDTQAGFAQAALSLDAAIHRAEAGLAEMRRATQDAELNLTERVDEARAAARKLDEVLGRARNAPAPVEAPPEAREAFVPPRLRAVSPRDYAPAPAAVAEASPRSRARVDDDLFDDGFQELRLRVGAGR